MTKLGAVVLLSGGLDSAVALAMAKESFSVHALTVTYGQRHLNEVEAARRVGHVLGVESHRFVDVVGMPFGASALLSGGPPIPRGRSLSEIAIGANPTTYVPARNVIFLSLAASWAESLEARCIVVGANEQDLAGYPDCRPGFFRAFEDVIRIGTKNPISVFAPLLTMGKAEIVRVGLRLHVPMAYTISCYEFVCGRPCGACDACLLRRAAFSDVGQRDPAEVQS
jgi:7-cyano-7-deazaguanine synthase